MHPPRIPQVPNPITQVHYLSMQQQQQQQAVFVRATSAITHEAKSAVLAPPPSLHSATLQLPPITHLYPPPKRPLRNPTLHSSPQCGHNSIQFYIPFQESRIQLAAREIQVKTSLFDGLVVVT